MKGLSSTASAAEALANNCHFAVYCSNSNCPNVYIDVYVEFGTTWFTCLTAEWKVTRMSSARRMGTEFK